MRSYPRRAQDCLVVLAGLLVLLFLPYNVASYAQTQQLLAAPVVNIEVRVRWNPSNKAIEWEADDKQPFRTVQTDTLFLTKQSIYVTYPQLNPLSLQATASATAVDDPSYATITKLIAAITSVATTVGPALPVLPGAPLPAAPAAPSVTCSSASNDIEALRGLLYGADTQPATVSKTIQTWIDAVDNGFKSGQSGPQAITAGITSIKTSASYYGKMVTNATTAWGNIKNCASSTATPADQKGLYAAVSLIDINPRIQQLASVSSAANQLADLLTKQYAVPEKWMVDPVTKLPTDFVISSEVIPTAAKMQNVTVKVVNVDLKVDPTTSAVSTDQQAAGSATFSVRRYSSFAPEIGLGAVFGTITVPSYGTATNSAGQTVVSLVKKSSVSVNPTILANFVCRCGSTIIVPMFQVGAATSTSLPAILAGGGLRLFGLGKGDVAIGGGAMFAWYKDLQTLSIGSTVTGTSQINSDLGYISAPKIGGYFAIQYKFQ